ncbi:MAG: ABC transporter ATP-binding protein, partial [Rhodocyclaceae bacterium]|nr:ABC transporter ATP-binding protein [Rhodocyclaceae bacterium]
RERVAARLQFDLADRLRQRCFSSLLGAEWRWIAAGRRSDQANLLLTDISRVGVGFQFGLNLAASTATLTVYCLAAFALSWKITLLALATCGLGLFLLAGRRLGALDLGRSLVAANRAMHANVQESLAGIKLAKILGNESRHLALFAATMARLRDQHLGFVSHSALARALFQFGGAALLAAYLYAGLTTWRMPLAELATLVLIFARIIPQFAAAQQHYHHWLHALPALHETQALLQSTAAAAEPPAPLHETPPALRRALCLRDVSVHFPGRADAALSHVDLLLPARSTIAITGPSGAGKSTLADLLCGLLVPDGGSVLVDDQPLGGSARLAWRRQVAYVPQEVFLFDDSIGNNLRWAKADATAEELERVLRLAGADFVLRLPQGLDTPAGAGGSRLSGGERQRIALARALLRRPSLLILDEATSALDAASAAQINAAIAAMHGELTIVMIGHQPEQLRHADQLVVLAEGRVANCGNWQGIGVGADKELQK